MKNLLLTISFLFLASVSLTACELNIPKISWEKAEPEAPQIAATISGTLFPFDVSVATEATHRLESDGKLVALIASDIVNLEIFEGRLVEMVGFMKSEGKRNVFWAHSLDLKENLDDLIDENELFDDEYIKANGYTFLYPKNWEMFTAPDGSLYFSEKGDANRRAFFTFKVADVEEIDAEKSRNVLIAGLKGAKEILAEEKRERQTIELFSSDESTKYVFQFNSLFEEFEKKNDFFQLLNSFVVGDTAVEKIVAERQKAIADKKETQLKKQDELSEIRAQLEALKESEIVAGEDGTGVDAEKASVFDKLLDLTAGDKKQEASNTEEEEKDDAAEAEDETETVAEKIETVTADFENLIDGRAYSYESGFLKLSLKIPYGFWFQNFGDVNGTIATIGVQKSPIDTLSGTDFRIQLVEKEGGVAKIFETNQNGTITIDAPRPGFKNSIIRLVGSEKYRDAMRSVVATIK